MKKSLIAAIALAGLSMATMTSCTDEARDRLESWFWEPVGGSSSVTSSTNDSSSWGTPGSQSSVLPSEGTDIPSVWKKTGEKHAMTGTSIWEGTYVTNGFDIAIDDPVFQGADWFCVAVVGIEDVSFFGIESFMSDVYKVDFRDYGGFSDVFHLWFSPERIRQAEEDSGLVGYSTTDYIHVSTGEADGTTVGIDIYSYVGPAEGEIEWERIGALADTIFFDIRSLLSGTDYDYYLVVPSNPDSISTMTGYFSYAEGLSFQYLPALEDGFVLPGGFQDSPTWLSVVDDGDEAISFTFYGGNL